MNRPPTIHILSDATINKIAAGEVVERPASVLKELVENALDAGARCLEVELVAAGRRLIAVADDGRGMSRDDALLAVERHATSKIRAVDDLDRIATLGFRGEALAAIAAVSRFSLLTRSADALGGTQLSIHGGTLQDVVEKGSPVGTRIDVRDLFYNMPARRRFLRAEATEAGHLRLVLQTYALGHPEARLRMTQDGTLAMELAPARDLAERLAALFGADWVRRLRPLEYQGGGLQLSGYVGLPTLHRADRSAQYLFVNGRPAGAPVIGYALRQAYADAIPKGRHAVAVLFLALDPREVDVNVHPTKREVRFRRALDVRDALLEAVRAALRSTGSARPAVPVGAAVRGLAVECTAAAAAVPPPALETPRLPWSLTPAGPAARREAPVPEDPGDELPAPGAPWNDVVLLGRLAPPYVILRAREGLIIMDVSAAHARVLYEGLLRRAGREAVKTQGLLEPAVIEMLPREAQAVREHLELLRGMGFGVEPFGDRAFRVDTLPACLGAAPVERVLLDCVRACETGSGRRRGWDRERIASAAVRCAVRDDYSDAAVAGLVAALSRTAMPYTCPQGRPTVVLWSYRELDRRFGKV